MKAKKEANWYDKVFTDNLDAITLSLIEKVLGISVARQDDFRPNPVGPGIPVPLCQPDGQ